jgi:hypothetical protein
MSIHRPAELPVQPLGVSHPTSPPAVRRVPLVTALLLSVAILAAAFYGRLRANLESEYFNIAQAMVAGRGFADAMGGPTGPTAWMPPVLPLLEAALLRAANGDHDAVVAGLVVLHVGTLIGTVFLVFGLAAPTTRRLGTGAAAALLALALLYHAYYWFQLAHDCWLPLLLLDMLLAGLCWLRPFDSWQRAAVWGLFGGLCTLAHPVIALVWGILSLTLGSRRRWSRPALALLCAGMALVPWTVRNYVVFGRLIPVKANLAYELYQSQCLQPDGLLQATMHQLHPANVHSAEHREYVALGEVAYLERKWQQFADALRAAPGDFPDRVASRFLGATLWYVPHNRVREAQRPWLLRLRRLTHSLPFLALTFLLFTAGSIPLSREQWAVIGVYALYLLPYIVASYYERYTVPLVAVKVLLILWAADRLLVLSQTYTTTLAVRRGGATTSHVRN